jgi:hypothetical protein
MVHVVCSACGAYGPGVVVPIGTRPFSELEPEIRRLAERAGWEVVHRALKDPLDLCPGCSGNLMRYEPMYFDAPRGPKANG